MTPRSWKRRITIIVDRLQPAAPSPFVLQMREESARRRTEHLVRIPADLRAAVAAALDDRVEDVSEWAEEPFARWAMIPPGFQYPRDLVTWLLNPPRKWWLGHACGSCGLNVPLLETWTHDPDPPQGGVIVFPACPSCGSPTSFAATSHSVEAVGGLMNRGEP
jgi:hypothetical protein